MVMIDSIVIVAIIVAVTWLISLRVWLSDSARATASWKGRYMTLKRQMEEGGEEADLSGLLQGLPEDIRPMVEPIIESLPKKYRGIAEWLAKNPQIVKMGLELLSKTKKPISSEAL